MTISKYVTAASVVAVMSTSATLAQDDVLNSAGALAFDNGNTLFVGDGNAGLVHAFDLGDLLVDQAGYQLGRAQTFEGRTIFDNLNTEIAGLLGVEAKDVVIDDMVVHKPSKQVLMSVHRGNGLDAEAVIIAVNNGTLELMDLSKAEHSSMSVGPVPRQRRLNLDSRTIPSQ